MNYERFTQKLTEDLKEIEKRLMDVANTSAKETLSVTSGLLKGLAKELGTLGEQVDKWAERAKAPAETPPAPAAAPEAEAKKDQAAPQA